MDDRKTTKRQPPRDRADLRNNCLVDSPPLSDRWKSFSEIHSYIPERDIATRYRVSKVDNVRAQFIASLLFIGGICGFCYVRLFARQLQRQRLEILSEISRV